MCTARELARQEFEAYLAANESGMEVLQDEFSSRLNDPEAKRLFQEFVLEYERMMDDIAPQTIPSELGGYSLGKVLGRGGMGEVFEARAVDGSRVALKLLPRELALQTSAVARLQREVEVLSQLNHRHIVRHLDHDFSGPRPFIVLEHVSGGTLEERLALRSPRSRESRGSLRQDAWVRVYVEWMIEVLDALEAAHKAGVVHRDIKPANILLDQDDHVRVADFGLAHLDLAQSLTSTGRVMGTPGYLAPERVLDPNSAHDPRVDVYAVATTLFKGLTGSLPFPGDLPQMLAAAAGMPPRLDLFLGPVNEPGLEAIFERGLAGLPTQRYPSAAAFSADLRAWLSGRPVQARRGRLRRRFVRRVRARPIRWGAGLLLVLIALGLGVRSLVTQHERGLLATRRMDEAQKVLNDQTLALDRYRTLLSPKGIGRVNDWHAGTLVREELDPREAEQTALMLHAAALRREAEQLLLQDLEGPKSEEAVRGLQQLNAGHAQLLALAGDWVGSEEAWKDYSTLGGELDTAQIALTTTQNLEQARLSRYQRDSDSAVWPLVLVHSWQKPGKHLELNALEPGSYLLELRRSGQSRWIRMPLLLRRSQRWEVDSFQIPSDSTIGVEWEYIPPGEFIAGGDRAARNGEPRTLRRIQEGFFMAKYEVRVGEYKRFLRAILKSGRDDWYQTRVEWAYPGVPVQTPRSNDGLMPLLTADDIRGESQNAYFKNDRVLHSISPDDAQAYVEWLNSESSDWVYSLPSGDEWEFAARGADGRLFPWGNSLHWDLTMGGPSKLLGPQPFMDFMRPGFFPNDCSPFGIFDLAGNVREPCRDVCHFGRKQESYFLVRGGEQSKMSEQDFHSAVRWEAVGALTNFDFGIRLVRRPR